MLLHFFRRPPSSVHRNSFAVKDDGRDEHHLTGVPNCICNVHQEAAEETRQPNLFGCRISVIGHPIRSADAHTSRGVVDCGASAAGGVNELNPCYACLRKRSRCSFVRSLAMRWREMPLPISPHGTASHLIYASILRLLRSSSPIHQNGHLGNPCAITAWSPDSMRRLLKSSNLLCEVSRRWCRQCK